MKTKYYHYFVSFTYVDIHKNRVIAMSEITSLYTIKSFDDIQNIAAMIRKSMQDVHRDSVIMILNYQLIRNIPY